MAWQPIETAPQGVPILVRGPEGISLVEYDGRDWFVTAEGSYMWDGGGDQGMLVQATSPTEWHPIPE